MMRFLLFLLLGAAAQLAMAQAPKLELPKLEVSVNRIDHDGQHMYEVDATGTVGAAAQGVAHPHRL
jgi:hypothetical protein